ncbi:MAG: PTS transporter subunit EIIC [Mycoplasma sp.]
MRLQTTKSRSWSDFFSRAMSRLGKIGKVLMFPIAVLPIAAILLRIGAQMPVISGVDEIKNSGLSDASIQFMNFVSIIMSKSGGIVFDYLPLLFAIAIGFGFAKDNRGEAAFSAGISMLLLMALMAKGSFVDIIYGNFYIAGAQFDINGAATSDPLAIAKGFAGIFGNKYNAALSSNVLNGIIVGSISAYIYNKFTDVEIPKILGFFSGRRLIPSIVILTTGVWAVIYAVVFPWVGYLFYLFSDWLYSSAGTNRWGRSAIMGIYGFINRLLLPFGLHHIPNNLFWFQLGEWHDAAGKAIYGDISIFLNGDAANNPGGIFQSGFFPVMMFGLPTLAALFYFTAEGQEQKRRVFAIFGSAAIVSFLTGITEPIEFAFMFVSPLLYFIHAVLTGIFGFITGAFGIQLGFGFSAGFMDYLLSIPKSLEIIAKSPDRFTNGFEKVLANPGWIIPIGLVCSATYFSVGYLLIKKFNLETPGRGKNLLVAQDENESSDNTNSASGLSPKAIKVIKALGGYENITLFNNCATRLRYSVKDMKKVNEADLKKAGAMGVIKISQHDIQIIIGTQAESLNYEIETHKGTKL